MSKNEVSRRQLCQRVMRYAWLLFKKKGGWLYGFAACLKLAWNRLRGLDNSRHTKVVGVSFKNDPKDGGHSRQDIISKLLGSQRDQISLELMREPANPYDSNAVAVLASVRGGDSYKIGYINRGEAIQVASLIDSGHFVAVVLENIVGGGGLNYGVNISYSQMV